MLDLFDVEFGDEGAISLSHSLTENKTLKILQTSNTKITKEVFSNLIKSVMVWRTLGSFRFWNLLEFDEEYDFASENRVISIEYRETKISKSVYKTENRLDITQTIVEDYFKIPDYCEADSEELNQFFHKYLDYVLNNWIYLEKGKYFRYDDEDEVDVAQKLPTDKHVLDQQIVQNNDPLLEEDSIEYKLLGLKRIENNTKLFYSYFSGDRDEQIDALKAAIAAKSKERTIMTGKQEEGKIEEDEYLASFIQRCAYTRNMGKQILHILWFLNSNPNYIDTESGLSAIMKWIVSRNVSALKILLNSWRKFDLNLKADKGEFEGMAALHLCVLTKEIELLDAVYHYDGDIILDMDNLNYNGETPIDLVENMKDIDHQSKSI